MDPIILAGNTAPEFSLPELEGELHHLSGYRGRLVVLNFWSAECPWAERADRQLLEYLEQWPDKVILLPVASNANEAPEMLARVAAERGLPPVLHDTQRQVADLYGAQTTPHLFLIDEAGILRYQGALDDVTFRRRQPTQHYLRQAVDALLAGRQPEPTQTQPYGCALVRYRF